MGGPSSSGSPKATGHTIITSRTKSCAPRSTRLPMERSQSGIVSCSNRLSIICSGTTHTCSSRTAARMSTARRRLAACGATASAGRARRFSMSHEWAGFRFSGRVPAQGLTSNPGRAKQRPGMPGLCRAIPQEIGVPFRSA